MENGIIIYGSRYGATKRYADELAKRLNTTALDYRQVSELNLYDTIIYMGGLYAGGVLGMAETLKTLNDTSKARVLVVTVGLADPENQENVDHIRMNIQKQVPDTLVRRLKIYHLRGAIDYAKLSLKYKLMMRLVYNKARKMPVEEQTPEVKAMIETYGKQVDFVDFSRLQPIIHLIKT